MSPQKCSCKVCQQLCSLEPGLKKLDDRLTYVRKPANLQDRVEHIEGHLGQVSRATPSPTSAISVNSRKNELVADPQRALAEKLGAFRTTRDQLQDAKIAETEKQEVIDEQAERIKELQVRIDHRERTQDERLASARRELDETTAQKNNILQGQRATIHRLYRDRKQVEKDSKARTDNLLKQQAEASETQTAKLLEQRANAHTEADGAKTRELADMVQKLDENWQKMTQQMATIDAKDKEIAELKSKLETANVRCTTQKMTQQMATVDAKDREIAEPKAKLQTSSVKPSEQRKRYRSESVELSDFDERWLQSQMDDDRVQYHELDSSDRTPRSAQGHKGARKPTPRSFEAKKRRLWAPISDYEAVTGMRTT